MTIMPKGYSATQIALHWAVVILIAAQFLFSGSISAAYDRVGDGAVVGPSVGIIAHVAGGIAVLLFAMWRLMLRQSRGAPDVPTTTPPVMRTASHWGHVAIYALLFIVPMSGMVAWFGQNPQAAQTHVVLKSVLLVLAVGHVGAALLHQFWLKDRLLLRMARPRD